MSRRKTKSKPIAKKVGKFRSKFEQELSRQLNKSRVKYKYENLKIPYVLEKNYVNDFQLLPNGILIEAKGVLSPADRQKMKAVKEQHPELDIRFVFQRAENKLSKHSKTTYAQWAEKNGFKWANKRIPISWIKEQPLKK